MLAASTRVDRLPGLDLLRAVAVIWVMFFHSFVVGGLGPHFEWLSRYGWMGVDIFFVLSGYLIGTQVLRPLQRGEPLAWGAFYARRAWRILPVFAVVLALYACLPGLREVPGLAPWWQFATFTMNLLIDYGNHPAFSHAWSLCVEEHFYLLFPLLAWWLTRRPSLRKFVIVALGVVLAGIALRAGIWLHDSALDPPRNWFIEDIYFPTWTRLDGLLTGVSLAALRVYRPQLWARLQTRANRCLLGGLLVTMLALWLFRDRVGLLGNAIGWPVLSFGLGLLVLAGADRTSAIGRWTVPGAGWIAAMSYSLYLSHKLALHAVQVGIVLPWQLHGLRAFACYAVGVLLLGGALHYLIERPFLQWRDRRKVAPFSQAAGAAV